MRLRIQDLPVKEFSGDMIDNCFHVERGVELSAVQMSDISQWIKEKAINGGLTVKMEDGRIMFISRSK